MNGRNFPCVQKMATVHAASGSRFEFETVVLMSEIAHRLKQVAIVMDLLEELKWTDDDALDLRFAVRCNDCHIFYYSVTLYIKHGVCCCRQDVLWKSTTYWVASRFRGRFHVDYRSCGI